MTTKRKSARKQKPIRVGVIGVGRGHGFAAGAGPHLGMELVALCDTWEERLLKVGRELGVTTYTDYFMNYHFAEAIRTGKPPYWDVYRGVAASVVGILAYRSALQDSAPLDVPDVRDPVARAKYAGDRWSPDPATRKPGDPWPSVLGDIPPSPKALAYARKCWKKQGYTGE